MISRSENDPTDEEMAAIMVAVDVVWPRPAPELPPLAESPNRWRFSGRWWARPSAARRERPWRR